MKTTSEHAITPQVHTSIESSPAAFRASHGPIGAWTSVDFEVYEHLVETSPPEFAKQPEVAA